MIVGIAGPKQSGKNTVANIIHGLYLKNNDMIRDFNIDANGKLYVLTNIDDNWGEFDISRKDEKFSEWADLNMWPYVKLYSFADSLKWICINLFNIPEKCVYGTDEDKNQIIPHLQWENMPGVIDTDDYLSLTNNHYGGMGKYLATKLYPNNNGPMTAREFMQFLGTEIMRKMYSDIWVDNTISKIKKEGSERAIIADVRFPNEVEKICNNGGKLIKLTRSIHSDSHASENSLALINDDKFDHIIDNGSDKYSILDLINDIKNIYNTVLV